MKIVIDIPEDSYKATCNGCMLPSDVKNAVRGIKNGVPLPDGAEILTKEAYSDLCTRAADVPDTNVGDLISREAAKLKVARVIWEDGDSCNDFHDKCVDCLDDLPSVERECGKLIRYSVSGHYACKCSKCNMDLGYPYDGIFCKWCGAKMEVEE